MGVIIGTAGHIDHGKSSLVKYLTGTDPDRLKEEKERGITIELGYVFMPLPDGETLAFIDVPGHERFVRQMVAGVATVDRFLLVVAADEGVMPQTREHLDILRLLGVTRGIVALTKCDAVGPDMLDLAESDVRGYLSDTPFGDAPIYRVSALTGEGMEELREALVRLATETVPRSARGKFRLDVDRVFVLKGFGTIVAGTAMSGSVSTGDRLELQPGGQVFRVREMSVNHHRNASSGSAGDRIALNMVGLEAGDVERGSCFAEPGHLKPRTSLDTECSLLPSAGALKRHQRVRFHTGTAEVMARAVPVDAATLPPGSGGFVHFQLESPVVALHGDRFVIRRYSPVVTIGGGVILETDTRKVRSRDTMERAAHLELLSAGDLSSLVSELLEKAGPAGITLAEAAAKSGVGPDEMEREAASLREAGIIDLMRDGSVTRVVDMAVVGEARGKLLDTVRRHHESRPASPGVALSTPGRILAGSPAWFVRSVVAELEAEGSLVKRGEWFALPGHPEELPADLAARVRSILSGMDAAGLDGFGTASGDPAMLDSLRERGLVLDLAQGVSVSAGYLDGICARAAQEFGEEGFGLAELRDVLGVSRKVALQWAELMDRTGRTLRKGDRRVFQSRR
jgi:selenocysteine-specific elongation factor